MQSFHQKLFFLLVLFLPSQLGYFFFPDWALVRGLRVDFLAPVIYFTDILLALLLTLWLLGKRKFPVNKTLLFFLAVFVFVNTGLAMVWQISIFKWVTVVEMVLLGLYVKDQWGSIKNGFWKALPVAIGYTAIIATFQFLLERTLGGLLYFLGERTFSSSIPGIALFSLWGREVLRPYGTFPHPNSLGSFGLVSFFLLASAPRKWLTYLGLGAAVFLVGISFSQNAWAVFVVSLIFYLLVKKKREQFSLGLLGAAVILSLLQPMVAKSMDGFILQEPITKRLILAKQAGEFFADSPLVGVGLGNFIAALPAVASWWLHPVHNIFLLVLVETGVVGFMFFGWLLMKSLVKALTAGNWGVAVALMVIVLTGLADHYWLTLHQNLLLFAIVVGIAHAKES